MMPTENMDAAEKDSSGKAEGFQEELAFELHLSDGWNTMKKLSKEQKEG